VAYTGEVVGCRFREVTMKRSWRWGILFFWLVTVGNTWGMLREVGWLYAFLFWGVVLVFYRVLPLVGYRVASWVLHRRSEIAEGWLRVHAIGLLVTFIALYLLGPFLAGLVRYGLPDRFR
jgi:hypothetical protein